MKKFDKEFMLIFDNDQEYLISVPKLRWVYQHGIDNIKHYKEVDRELSVRQFESIHNNPGNGYYSFYYNGVLIKNFTINRYEHKNLVKLNISDKFPGYHEGHHADQQTGDTPQAEPLRSNGIGEGERQRIRFHGALLSI